MLKNYFKTAWRNLLKNKFYSLINISGLSVGLAVGILILLWVQYEFSFDGFHSNEENIYKLENMVGTGTSRQLWTETASPIGKLAKNEIPGVKDMVRISFNGYYDLFKYGDKTFTSGYKYFTDPSLFTIFDFPLIKGNIANPYPDDNSVVMTESLAKKYFGNEEPLGKVIVADGKTNFKITGVVKDFPKNSTFHAEMFFPISLLAKEIYRNNKEGKNMDNDFSSYDYTTFLLFNPGFSFQGFTDKLRQIHLHIKADDTDIEYVMLPLKKVHLYRSDGGDGGFATVRMFLIIAIFILVIACINYINLSTARSILRAKEVSLRKIVGAAKVQLFLQFIVETALLFLFATVFAILLVYILLPLFNQISGKEIVFDFSNIQIWKVFVLTITGTLIISSIYPAILLSSFQPLNALKGKVNTRISDAAFRKVLVVIQFSFSMILITGTIVIGNQLSYIRSKYLGYDREHVLTSNIIHMKDHLQAIKSDLLNQPGIQRVTAAGGNIVWHLGQTGSNWWEGKEEGETMMVSPISIDKDFIPFFKMDMKEGKAFTGSVADSAHFILNETAVKAVRIKDPIGKKFKLWETEGTIIGVVKDFHSGSMREKIKPVVMIYSAFNNWTIYIKTTGKDAPKAIAALERQWKKYNSDFPFEYSFLDEQFNNLYKSEQRTGLLFNVFAAIAIFISCLGLFGLAAYTAQLRTREIGVRKVLGASLPGIVRLLAGDFIKLVFIAILLATPISWYVMNKWLQDFAYKTNIGWVVFLLSGIIAVLIALFTISFQSLKAAMANPVKSLRTE